MITTDLEDENLEGAVQSITAIKGTIGRNPNELSSSSMKGNDTQNNNVDVEFDASWGIYRVSQIY